MVLGDGSEKTWGGERPRTTRGVCREAGLLNEKADGRERERQGFQECREWVDVTEKGRVAGPPASTQVPAGSHLTA